MAQVSLCYVVNEFIEGSVNTLIHQIIKASDPDEYEFHVLALKPDDGAMKSAFQDAGAAAFNTGLGDRVGYGALRQLRRYFAEHSIQMVHTHVLRPDVLGGLAGRLARHPIVLSTKHNPRYSSRQPAWIMRNAVYWPVMYLPHHIITVTDLIRQQAIASLRINPSRITTIHNGVETDKFYCPEAREPVRAELGLGPHELALMYVGRVIEGKGLSDLLPAVATIVPRHPELRVVIVGDGPIRGRLEHLAQELGMRDKVLFTGQRSDVAAVLAAADIFVLPSFIEGLPLSMLEAMSAGKPVVAGISGGVPEVISDGEHGLLHRPGDRDGLVAALTRMIEDPEQRQCMAEAGQRRAREHFSVERMIARHHELYRRLLPH